MSRHLIFLKTSLRKCILQSAHKDTEKPLTDSALCQRRHELLQTSLTTTQFTPQHHYGNAVKSNNTDDIVLTLRCSTNSSGNIPDSESDVFWYILVTGRYHLHLACHSYSTGSFTSHRQLLPPWHNSRLLSTLQPHFHWQADMISVSSPSLMCI